MELATRSFISTTVEGDGSREADARKQKKEMRRRMEVLFRETTKSLVPLSQPQPGVITVEGTSNKEPQEDDSCSQATTAKGWTRPSALNGTDLGNKIKKTDRNTASGDKWNKTGRG